MMFFSPCNHFWQTTLCLIALLLSGISNVEAEPKPTVCYDRLQGVIKSIDPGRRTVQMQLRDGSQAQVRVADNAWCHLVSSLDKLDRRPHLKDIFSGNNGQLISVSGLIYSGSDHMVAKDVTLFGSGVEDLVFEDPDWWSSQARELARFWTKTQLPDGSADSYRTKVTKSGTHRLESKNLQETATLSRLIYGLSSTYMITGEQWALNAAKKLVDFQRNRMRCQSPDGKYVYWAHALKDGKRILPSLFDDDSGTIPLYEQIYDIAGLTQYYRITGDKTVLADVKKTITFMDEYFWDNDSADKEAQGYYSHISPVTWSPSDTAEHNRQKKNWNSIGDHLPAYLSNLYLGTRDKRYLARLRQLGHFIVRYFPDPGSPFVFERFDKNWQPDLGYRWQQNRGVVGHNLKIAWVLTRLYHLTGEQVFLDVAVDCADQMISHGEDLRRGGWYDVMEREPNPENGHYELTWHDRKAWWQQEQGILANYVLYGTLGQQRYLDAARSGSAFYNLAFPDHDDGGVYFDVQADGTPYLLGDRADKGSHSKSGYHSMELTFFAHLYTNLLIKRHQVGLHFRPIRSEQDQILHVQPVSFPKDRVFLTAVTINGRPWPEFDRKNMQIHLPVSKVPLEVVAFLQASNKQVAGTLK